MPYSFTTPVGRMVYGSVWDGSDRAKDGTQRITKTGPNAGKPLFTWSFGVAFPKVLQNGMPNAPFQDWYRAIHEEARAAWPQYMNGQVDPITGKPGPSHPRFAMKIADGDGIDGDGKQNSVKEGWAGHWVVKFASSAGAPRVYDINIGFDPTQQLQDKTRCLPGDYVAVQGSCSKNDGDTPGLYMNGNMVCLIGGGQRIVTGPRAADAFSNLNMGALPPGCTPGANPSTIAPPPATGAVVPPPAVPNAPHDPIAKATADGWEPHPSATGYRYKGQEVKTDAEVAALYPAPAAIAPPPAPPAPNHAFVANAAGVPPAPGVAVPPPPAAPSGPQMTSTGAALGTYASFKTAGWSDEALRASGYIV